MYTSKGYTVVMPNGHTSSFKTPATDEKIESWRTSQKEIDVEWPDRPDVSPVKPTVSVQVTGPTIEVEEEGEI